MHKGHDGYQIAEQARLAALLWVEHEMRRLLAIMEGAPDDRQARADARLLLEAVEEVVVGREPRSVAGGVGRITRTASAEEWRRLGLLRELRQQIPRAPAAKAEQAAAPPPSTPLAGEALMAAAAWRDLVRFAALLPMEADALLLHWGHGWSLDRTAQALGTSPGTVRRRMASGWDKLQRYVASRGWRSAAAFINER